MTACRAALHALRTELITLDNYLIGLGWCYLLSGRSANAVGVIVLNEVFKQDLGLGLCTRESERSESL